MHLQEMDMNVVFCKFQEDHGMQSAQRTEDPNAVQWINLSFQKFTAKINDFQSTVACLLQQSTPGHYSPMFTIPREVGRQNNQ